MHHEDMTRRQYFAMGTTATVAPLIVVSAKVSWVVAVFCAVLFGIALYCVEKLEKSRWEMA